MNISILTQDKQDAVKRADELLAQAGLPTYTELVESRQRALDSVSNAPTNDKANDALTCKLLNSALEDLFHNRCAPARVTIQNLLEVYEK